MTRLHWKTYTVPVGQTPVPKYASWDDHRAAISRDAEAARLARSDDKRHQTSVGA